MTSTVPAPTGAAPATPETATATAAPGPETPDQPDANVPAVPDRFVIDVCATFVISYEF